MQQNRKDKRFRPRSEETKQKIRETLEGKKQGQNDFVIRPEDGAELRSSVTEGDRFRHQALIDWWRDLKGG